VSTKPRRRLRVEPHGFMEAALQVRQPLHVGVRGERPVAQHLVELTPQQPQLLRVLWLELGLT